MPPLIVDQKHLFEGEVRHGKATGFHHRGGIPAHANARVVTVIDPPNSLGVYTAEVEIRESTSGAWHPKPFSTFFPDAWTRQRVLDEVEHAYTHRSKLVGMDWEGPSTTGFTIVGHMTAAGTVASAYPIYRV